MKKIRSIPDFFPVWVLVLALVAGLLYVLPPALIKKAAEREGRFFVLPNLNHLSDDALYYLPRAREIYEGHFPTEMHVAEYKDAAWFVYPPLPQAITAGFMALTRGDVPSAVIGIIFVFGIINFLCFYAVAAVLLRSRLWAAAVATAALFTHVALRIPAVFYQKGIAIDIIANMLPRLRVPVAELSLVRIDDPLLTLPLYLISFLLLLRFSVQPTAKRGAILGATIGVLSYIYLYYWVAIFAIAALLFLHDAFRAWRSASFAKLKSWAVFFGAFGLVFLPQVVNFFIFRSLPGGMDYIARKGIESGRALRLSVYPDYIFYAIAGIAAFFLFRKNKGPRGKPRGIDLCCHRSLGNGKCSFHSAHSLGNKPDAPEPPLPRRFALAMLIGMALLWNAQLITGFNMEPFHWWKAFAPLLFFLTLALTKTAYDRVAVGRPRVVRAASVVLIALLLSLYGKKVLNAAAFLRPPAETVRSYSVPRSIAASWEWINVFLPPGSAIISPSLVSSNQISIFTHADPWMPAPLNSLAPTAATEQRFVEAHKILGASSDEMLLRLAGPPFAAPGGICPDPCVRDRDHFRDRFEFSFEFYSFGLLYGVMFSPALEFDAITKPADGSMPQEALERLRAYYDAYQPRPDDFPLHTYVYVGPWERLLSEKAGDAFADVKPVFANEEVQIYRIR